MQNSSDPFEASSFPVRKTKTPTDIDGRDAGDIGRTLVWVGMECGDGSRKDPLASEGRVERNADDGWRQLSLVSEGVGDSWGGDDFEVEEGSEIRDLS